MTPADYDLRAAIAAWSVLGLVALVMIAEPLYKGLVNQFGKLVSKIRRTW